MTEEIAQKSKEEVSVAQNGKKRNETVRKMKMNWQIYLMILPVVVFYLVFSYAPMYGITLAFKNYLPRLGILGSPWAGIKHFQQLFANPSFTRAVRNTLVISGLKILICFPMPILLALLLNELKSKGYKKFIQTAIYLPNFISWIIIGGLMRQILSISDGLVNNLIVKFGGESIPFLTSSDWFYTILIFCEIWHSAGWGTIIYIAALSGIDPTLYEASMIDGAGRFRQIWNISIPSIMPVVIVMLLMQVGGIMNAGFDPIFNLYNATVYDVADIIDTLVYRLGLSQNEYELSTALGLFKNIINFVLIMGANIAAKKISGYSMYSFD